MNGFLDIRRIIVPIDCVAKSHTHLAKVGKSGLEGFALWAGRRRKDNFFVEQTIIPAQQGLKSDAGVCVVVDEIELHRINVWLYENRMSIIAQLHSHPTDAYHSETDDTYPIATTLGCVSLVIPDFAVNPFSLDSCAIYRLLPPGIWTELSIEETANLIILE